jgi:hypothetical protein
MWAADTRAPSYEVLRPLDRHRADERRDGHLETDGFPVYRNLVDMLAQPKEHPDEKIAHVLGVCAGYAYSGMDTVAMIMARMGLADNHCRMITTSVDAMLICSTAFLVQSADGRVVILCYRGTEPSNFVNWLTDVDVEPERINYQFDDPCASVHGGFYRNVRATRYEVLDALQRALEGKSVRKPIDGEPDEETGKLEALYITGHSLGGAMAAMMGVMLQHETKARNIRKKLKAVYTFGQPMIGDPSFAAACQRNEFLRENLIRYVNDSDVVPHLPPGASGPFQHFGRERQFQAGHLRQSLSVVLHSLGCAYQPRTGEWRDKQSPTPQMPNVLGLAVGASMFAARKFQLLRALPVVYSFDDHQPHHYISALTPNGVSNEFGD